MQTALPAARIASYASTGDRSFARPTAALSIYAMLNREWQEHRSARPGGD